MRTNGWLCSFWLAPALLAAPALAVDGVREINHACATTTGCFTGDGAGYPVTIGASGSYRLTGSLTLPDAATHGISVETDHVTIDLNGFEIVGVALCSGVPVTCGSTGSGRAITVSDGLYDGLAVRNGRVRRAGDAGVFAGTGARIEDVVADSNGSHGIHVGANSQVVRCTATRNGESGIDSLGNSVITGNVVFATGAAKAGIGTGGSVVVTGNRISGAGGDGILTQGSAVVTGNSVTGSLGDGIESAFGTRVADNAVTLSTGFALRFTSSESGYAGNVFSANGGNVTGSATNLGGNLCAGVICP